MNHLNISPELSYVVGTRFGDGALNVNLANYNYALELAVTDYDFAVEFNRCVAFALGRTKQYSIFQVKGRDPKYKQLWKVVAYSKELIQLFQSGKWRMVSDLYPATFVRALGDSEGSPVCKTDRVAPVIFIEKSDPVLLEYVKGLLFRLGIESSILRSNKKGDRKTFVFKKDCYRLVIRRFSSVVTYMNVIGFSITRKQKKLENLVECKKRLQIGKYTPTEE